MTARSKSNKTEKKEVPFSSALEAIQGSMSLIGKAKMKTGE